MDIVVNLPPNPVPAISMVVGMKVPNHVKNDVGTVLEVKIDDEYVETLLSQ